MPIDLGVFTLCIFLQIFEASVNTKKKQLLFPMCTYFSDNIILP